jgi:hypothetical protein
MRGSHGFSISNEYKIIFCRYRLVDPRLRIAVVPANAAKQGVGCSGPNLTKAETMIETMADGEGKIVAQKEVAPAQDAMLSGKMAACSVHLDKAMHVGAVK